jgi:hypothetical protein
MKLIIQCAGRKQPDAGSLRMRTGQRVKFVAHPEEAPSSTDWFYAHPDGLSDIPGQTWRQQLAAYNANPLDNSLGLLEAYRLYRNPAYQELVAAFGLTKVFILSAAWGLVRADYLLPYYDLTFAHTKPGEGYKRRMQWDTYNDFSQLPNGENGPIVYFGGNNYLPVLKKVTSHIHCEKVIFFASANPPNDAQWRTIRFDRNFYVRRGKARFPSGRQTHPATFAPAGSNRSSRGGDEAAEAFGVEGHFGDSASMRAATCSER